ncbi:LysR family transcriptional regulator [Vallitaleaceae bacterium 9-2]
MLDVKLQSFLKVVELKNYTQAAKALNLTQPAITQHIKKLEEHYQCKLIQIIGKSVHLTAQGEALYHYANLQMANEDLLMNQLQKVAMPIKIGATLSIAQYYLADELSAYMGRSDDALSLTVKNTQSIIEMLLNNTLYCAFVEGIFDKSLFAYKQFCTTRFLPVARQNHPLAGRTIQRVDTYAYPLILREQGSGTREIYENYLYQNNDTIHLAKKIYEISSFGVIKKILKDTDAISFMYEKVAWQEVLDRQLCYLDIQDCHIHRPLYFIYPKNSLMKNTIETFYRRLTGQSLTPTEKNE